MNGDPRGQQCVMVANMLLVAMTNLGGAFVLPDLSSAFGELEAFSGEI